MSLTNNVGRTLQSIVIISYLGNTLKFLRSLGLVITSHIGITLKFLRLFSFISQIWCMKGRNSLLEK